MSQGPASARCPAATLGRRGREPQPRLHGAEEVCRESIANAIEMRCPNENSGLHPFEAIRFHVAALAVLAELASTPLRRTSQRFNSTHPHQPLKFISQLLGTSPAPWARKCSGAEARRAVTRFRPNDDGSLTSRRTDGAEDRVPAPRRRSRCARSPGTGERLCRIGSDRDILSPVCCRRGGRGVGIPAVRNNARRGTRAVEEGR